jgi:hypothetical protein
MWVTILFELGVEGGDCFFDGGGGGGGHGSLGSGDCIAVYQ